MTRFDSRCARNATATRIGSAGGALRRRGIGAAIASVVCAAMCLLAPQTGWAQPSTKPFEIVPGSFHITPSTSQAGAHEDLTTSFDLAHNVNGQTFNDVKSTVVNLPAGFTANNTAVPSCTEGQLLSEPRPSCPPASQIGTISFDLTLAFLPKLYTFPLYNMEVTNFGTAAELGFQAQVITQILPVYVRPNDLGLTVVSPSIEDLGEIHNVSVTVWGVPSAPVHDAERGRECFPTLGQPLAETECSGGGETVNGVIKPFLSNPTSCGAFTATMEADSWEYPEEWSHASSTVGPIAECSRTPFDPSLEVQPTTKSAESSSGLDLSILVPQSWGEPNSIATSNLKDVRLALPAGFTINPSAGAGLGACTPAQYAAETSDSLPGAGCPPESKIGSIEIETPVLDEKILGAIYIAKPYDNPFGTLLSLYVVAKDPALGILIKVAGKLEPDPVSGQIVATFDENPQQPFSRFTLKFRPGATAPLVSPQTCGTYTTQAELTPWSAPGEPQPVGSSFEITKGVHEGACPSGGVPPFKPQVISGTQNNAAGSYSSFYLRIIREDGEQELTHFSTTLPPGLSGNLSGIPFCSEADIEAARSTTGTQELETPSCPAASEIGHTIVTAGVGSVLAQTPGKVYLAGPYHGASLSIVSITSATVGPFDLGTVVIRFALRINPTTAQVEVDSTGSDPIPHIIDGIVVHVREIRVYMDREKFILDPTNCNPMAITDTVTGAGADFTNPADADPVTVNTPFQAADCSSLAFKPGFKVSTSGKTSRARGASLTAKLTFPSASLGSDANIARVKVELPKQLPSQLKTLQKACAAAQFAADPAGCPAASVVGHATATTPILPVPLSGPAYFVSHGGEEFPSLIVVLQGYGITIDLVGSTHISKAGITSSTFKTVPDVPVGAFELTLPEGQYAALAANGNLCKSKLAMPTEFVAQNGSVIHQSTKIAVTGCSKVRKAHHKKQVHKKRAGEQRGSGVTGRSGARA
jgi:hypothetical protein